MAKLTQAQIFAHVNGMVKQWREEGDTESPQRLMREGFLNLRWRLETEGQ